MRNPALLEPYNQLLELALPLYNLNRNLDFESDVSFLYSKNSLFWNINIFFVLGLQTINVKS